MRWVTWLSLLAAPIAGDVEWLKINQPCGQLEWKEPARRTIRRGEETHVLVYTNPVKRAKLRLYQAKGQDSACCDSAALVVKGVSGRYGEFRFPELTAGRYWLVVDAKGRELRVPLLVEEDYRKEKCEAPEVSRAIKIDDTPHPSLEVRIR